MLPQEKKVSAGSTTEEEEIEKGFEALVTVSFKVVSL